MIIIDGDYLIFKGACAAQTRFYRYYQDDGQTVMFDYKKEADAYIKNTGIKGQLKRIIKNKKAAFAMYYTKLAIQKIYERFSGEDIRLYVSSDKQDNHRYRIAKTIGYKHDRPAKPKHYEACRRYLVEHWDAKEVTKGETDDRVAIELTKYRKYDALLVHVDKDLNQVAGRHYNPDKDIEYEITELEGRRHLYTQIVIGDTSDGIPGLKYWCPTRTCGPATIEALLSFYETEAEIQMAIRTHILRLSDMTDLEYETRFKEMYDLLYLARTNEELKEIRGRV